MTYTPKEAEDLVTPSSPGDVGLQGMLGWTLFAHVPSLCRRAQGCLGVQLLGRTSALPQLLPH